MRGKGTSCTVCTNTSTGAHSHAINSAFCDICLSLSLSSHTVHCISLLFIPARVCCRCFLLSMFFLSSSYDDEAHTFLHPLWHEQQHTYYENGNDIRVSRKNLFSSISCNVHSFARTQCYTRCVHTPLILKPTIRISRAWSCFPTTSQISSVARDWVKQTSEERKKKKRRAEKEISYRILSL